MMRSRQVIIGAATIIISWYAMMAIHEAGHCIGAVATGAAVERVEIPLVGFSRTDSSGGEHPLLVVWAGPVLGVLLPLFLLPLGVCFRGPARHVLMFFVGFCLLANGVYLGAGAFVGTGDCYDLLRLGAPIWQLPAFGAAAASAGLCIWHRMGPPRLWFYPKERY